MNNPIVLPMTVSADKAEIPISLDYAVNVSINGSGGLPAGGLPGDILTKQGEEDYSVTWTTPADSPEQDNTRPITAGAVYTVVGNINALLATI